MSFSFWRLPRLYPLSPRVVNVLSGVDLEDVCLPSVLGDGGGKTILRFVQDLSLSFQNLESINCPTVGAKYSFYSKVWQNGGSSALMCLLTSVSGIPDLRISFSWCLLESRAPIPSGHHFTEPLAPICLCFLVSCSLYTTAFRVDSHSGLWWLNSGSLTCNCYLFWGLQGSSVWNSIFPPLLGSWALLS